MFALRLVARQWTSADIEIGAEELRQAGGEIVGSGAAGVVLRTQLRGRVVAVKRFQVYARTLARTRDNETKGSNMGDKESDSGQRRSWVCCALSCAAVHTRAHGHAYARTPGMHSLAKYRHLT